MKGVKTDHIRLEVNVPIKPITIKRKNTWRWKKPDYKPVLIPQPKHAKALHFKWYERVNWKSLFENIGMFVVGILRLFPKTALIGEILSKLRSKEPALYDKLLELIQLLINKIKLWRKK
jgi:hypothetical protein